MSTIIAALITAAPEVWWAVMELAKLRRERKAAAFDAERARQQAQGDGEAVTIPARELAMYKRLHDAVQAYYDTPTHDIHLHYQTQAGQNVAVELQQAFGTLHQYQQERQAR